MRFRWVMLMTLWTLLSGPMLALPEKSVQIDQSSQTTPGIR